MSSSGEVELFLEEFFFKKSFIAQDYGGKLVILLNDKMMDCNGDDV